MGFEREDLADEYAAVPVWPENWPLFRLYRRLQTQWICAGMGGDPMGLNYPSVYPLLDRQYPDPEAWWSAFEDIGQMELASLAAMAGKPLPGADEAAADDDEEPPEDTDQP